jgi:hypothetical protein
MVSERLQAHRAGWRCCLAASVLAEPQTRIAADRLPSGQQRGTRYATSRQHARGLDPAATSVGPVVWSQSVGRPAKVLRYPGTCLLSATPAPHLLYRPNPWQICRISKVPAYGTLLRTLGRAPIPGHLPSSYHATENWTLRHRRALTARSYCGGVRQMVRAQPAGQLPRSPGSRRCTALLRARRRCHPGDGRPWVASRLGSARRHRAVRRPTARGRVAGPPRTCADPARRSPTRTSG